MAAQQSQVAPAITVAVRFIAKGSPTVAINAHGPVAMVAVEWALRRVDRDQWIVHPEPITLRVSIGEQTSLQHLVRREADTGNDVRRQKAACSTSAKKFSGFRFRSNLAHLNQRVVRVWPHLGQVERMDVIGVRILFIHDLDVGASSGEIRPVRSIRKGPADCSRDRSR